MKETKVQWHPGFIAAMNLELTQNKKDLLFEKEYNLNTKPLEIDLLIIKKEAMADISSEIGKIFRGHNILEYKSPEDHLNIDVFYKTTAYACLYKSYGKTLDEVNRNINYPILTVGSIMWKAVYCFRLRSSLLGNWMRTDMSG